MQCYKIDRLTLGRNGLEASSINRLYKSLFVYSTGFNELIREILTHSENAYSSVTNIWRVFSILLEYSCKSDYEMIIGSIDKTIRDEIEDFQYKNNAKTDGKCRISFCTDHVILRFMIGIETFLALFFLVIFIHSYNLEIQENNQELKNKILNMTDYIYNLESQNNSLINEKDKLFNDKNEYSRNLEREVKIRLQYEK